MSTVVTLLDFWLIGKLDDVNENGAIVTVYIDIAAFLRTRS
jgi:hypothetical protein